ncbi:hypothetical protein E0W68_06970 [Flavobacterium salilacus subsp. salilacus]|uniref:hypothetical protein n=1 Tax=Flavobacterium TaxID=237 RepID=UPI001074E7B9|nr:MULTISPECIES: hypothetical protein [Flavobacterium]KAF2518993.1 hypothetical protein E0W68_06970 [Flavobacterium salilacus subsp. salilacus]MBE1614844.1 hypothetical protein [Flavobacterium sp. SaA2.13]
MANQTHNTSEDIDLTSVSGKIKEYINRINDWFFDWILFLKRNIILVAIIIIVGAALGYYMDSGKRVYEHRIVAIPNFGSIDYLYDNVEMINEKIKENDKEFLSSIGLNGELSIGSIKVEPIVEIYDFINDDNDEGQKKVQVFRLMAENDNMEDVLEAMPTARNYTKHLITLYTSGTTKQETTVDPIMKYLNSDTYFLKVKEEYIKSLEQEIAANDSTINNIDALLTGYSVNGRKTPDGNQMYHSDNTQLDEVIVLKNKLLKKQNQNRVNSINYNSIISQNSVVLNVRKDSITTGKMKFIVPFIFVFFIFIPIAMFKGYYRRQINKRKIIITNE